MFYVIKLVPISEDPILKRCSKPPLNLISIRHSSHQGESPQNGLGDEWTLWNDLGFSLYAAPSVCHMVTTSDEGEKV